MMWFFAVLIIAAIGAIAVVAAGEGAPLAPEYRDGHDVVVPLGRPLTGADLRAIRFNTGLRGYRADEVDALLTRLAAELDRARGQLPSGEPEVPATAEPETPATASASGPSSETGLEPDTNADAEGR